MGKKLTELGIDVGQLGGRGGKYYLGRQYGLHWGLFDNGLDVTSLHYIYNMTTTGGTRKPTSYEYCKKCTPSG